MDEARGDAEIELKLSLVEHATREDAHIGRVLSTAKLVTTFSAAFAATFVATALQVGQPTWLDHVAVCAMLVTLLTVGIVTVRKATLEPNDIRSANSAEHSALIWNCLCRRTLRRQSRRYPVQHGNSCADNHSESSSVSIKSTQTPPPGDRTLARLPIVAYWLRHDVDTHGDEFSPRADNGSLKAQGRLNE
jgi:hypothetical protein